MQPLATIRVKKHIHKRLKDISGAYNIPFQALSEYILTKALDQIETIPSIKELVENPNLLDKHL